MLCFYYRRIQPNNPSIQEENYERKDYMVRTRRVGD